MCGQCRTVTVDVDWYTSGAVDTLAGRRRARVELAAAADAALVSRGLRARTHPGMLAITVGTSSGRSAMVAGLSELQPTVAALSGHTLDPLDEAVIAAHLPDDDRRSTAPPQRASDCPGAITST